MTKNRFRWTRERYYRAHRLNRLLWRFTGNVPTLVQRLHELIDRTPGMHGTDMLTLPMNIRHLGRFGDPDVPF